MYVVLFSEFCGLLAFVLPVSYIICIPFDRGALMITRRTLEGAWK